MARSGVRCGVCRRNFQTQKSLKKHYTRRHSKIQIIQELMRLSVLHATPNSITRRRQNQTIYIQDNVQITYNHDTVLIVDESSRDNLIELIFEGFQPIASNKENRRLKRSKKSKRLFHVGIRKVVQGAESPHEHTGEFYECHCMEKSSDTESSCSDTGRVFHCNFCSGNYQTLTQLNQHQSFCEQRRQIVMQQPLVKLYVCYFCGFEVLCKEALVGHVWLHFEQQPVENILDMQHFNPGF